MSVSRPILPVYQEEEDPPAHTASIIHCPNGTIIGQSILIVRVGVGHGSDNEKKMKKMKKECIAKKVAQQHERKPYIAEDD